ncbi:MAG TPA: metalloregulator ArsR/SmtB family transcription factor [Lachnospiraceae bacterium]|nr:metalloregulator ArsR/SmtB family transcription factor [Lachnospiraceae bacterium]
MNMELICKALGNTTRYNLVKSIKENSIVSCCDRFEYYENGVSVGDVVKFTGLAQSTVSQHLAVLEEAGIIRKEKRELWSCYFLNQELLDLFMKQFRKDFLE